MLDHSMTTKHPDAALLSLGTRFQILCEAAASGDIIAAEALTAVADRIVKIPTQTLPGIIAKAKVAMVLKEVGQHWSLVEAFAMMYDDRLDQEPIIEQ